MGGGRLIIKDKLLLNAGRVKLDNNSKQSDFISRKYTMETLTLDQDLEGRIDNLNWKPSSQWSLPILEAVSNSLHATQHLDPIHRQIKITLIREGDDAYSLVSDKQRERPIVGFRIDDNGIGFNDDNLKAFSTLDTRHKRDIGGKGIGRLFWLKAFDNVIIQSMYSDNGNSFTRKIHFKTDGISYNTRRNQHNAPNRTTVEVIGIKPNYKKYYHKYASTVAKEIADEFLPHFILNGWPEIFTVSFTDTGESTASVKEYANYKDIAESFNVGPHKFNIIHVSDYQQNSHRILYCAAERVVSGYKSDATHIIPKKPLLDDENKQYGYTGLVSSEYLTKNVASERSGFLIPDKRTTQNSCEHDRDISLEEIDDAIASTVSNHLKPSLIHAQNETIFNINKVLNENPELKVITLSDDDVTNLVSSSENDIKRTFRHRLYEQLDNSKTEIEALISRIDKEKSVDFHRFKSDFDEEVRRFSLLNQSHIVSYILYRKHVIALLEKALTAYAGEKTALESFIHNLIFPMRKQNAPVDFGTNHNLWLNDDRLSMVDWIASDVSLDKHDILFESESAKEPDIVFYNLAYTDSANLTSASGYSEIHIVELKRPLTFNNNPIQQIHDYIFDIQNSKILHLVNTKSGYKETQKKIKVDENALFYGYVIFDVNEIRDTEKWRRISKTFGLKPFMNGYISHNDNTVIYVNSFESILEIAKKRNEIFFNKLNSTIPNLSHE